MAGADGDEVAVVGIVDGSGGIAIDCRGIGKQRTATRSDVTTGEDGVVDDDAIGIQVVPYCSRLLLVFQRVQVGGGHIVTSLIACSGNIDIGLTVGFHQHLAVLGEDSVGGRRLIEEPAFLVILEVVALVVIAGITWRQSLVVANTSLLTDAQLAFVSHIGTIYMSFITATEHVAVAIGHALVGAYLTTVDIDASLTEHIALTEQAFGLQVFHRERIHILGAVAAPAVLATTAAKDVAQHMAVVHVHLGAACPEDGDVAVFHTPAKTGGEGTEGSASDRSHLAATEEAAAYLTAIHIDDGVINITVDDIAATEDIS